MLIERPPICFRLTVPGGLFRRHEPGHQHAVYLTFDDGPIPEVTPWVLDVLDRYGIKATFFMVGDNVRKHPEVYEEVVRRGHRIGNHTMHHVSGFRLTRRSYLRDVAEARQYIDSDLFRPPHGWLRPRQTWVLHEQFRVVMFDLVTRDYSKWMRAQDVVRNVKLFTRDGSVIVFHDSLKSWPRLQEALPQALEWLLEQGYEFRLL
jgi:peptidoglycan/xylan/chitin deacetylase (PgdA/CDA1 family)